MSERSRAGSRRSASPAPARRSTAAAPGRRQEASPGKRAAAASPERALNDRFEDAPQTRRVGAHRAAARSGTGLVRFLWILLSAAVITALGIIFVVIGPTNLLFPETGTATPGGSSANKERVVGTVDPNTTITVLNGTDNEALTAAVVAEIRAQQWGIVEFTDSPKEEAPLSAVFFTDPKDEALAKGLGDELGGVFYYLREEYSIYDTQLVVLLADDYRGPGASE